MNKKDIQKAVRLQEQAEKRSKKRRRQKDVDIFKEVKRRKSYIKKREAVAHKRKMIEEEFQKKIKEDPIFSETNARILKKSEKKSERQARIQKSRISIIKSLTFETFRCPSCRKVKTNPKSWILSKDKKNVVCRSCFFSPKRKDLDFSKIKLFEKYELRYKIDSLSFCRMRTNLKLSVEQFAELIGWTPVYQYQLESNKFSTISEKTMKEIQAAFSKKGFNISLDIWGEPEKRYIVSSSCIRSARKLKGFSITEVSTQAGWSPQYQSKLERGKVQTISSSKADILNSILLN